MLKNPRSASRPARYRTNPRRRLPRRIGSNIDDAIAHSFEPVRSRWTWQPRLTELWLDWSRHAIEHADGT